MTETNENVEYGIVLLKFMKRVGIKKPYWSRMFCRQKMLKTWNMIECATRFLSAFQTVVYQNTTGWKGGNICDILYKK